MWNSRIGCFHWKSIYRYTYIVMNPTFFFIKQKQHHNFRKTKKPYCIEIRRIFPFSEIGWRIPNIEFTKWCLMFNFSLSFNSVFFHWYNRPLLSISSCTHVCKGFTSTSICNKGKKQTEITEGCIGFSWGKQTERISLKISYNVFSCSTS